jgi:molecular chaperone DnaK (HSP70)
VAFCETSDALETRIQVIQDWPTAHSMIGTKEKVPSEIAYVDDGRVLWGSSIPPHVQRHLWTKLDLDSSRSGEAANIRNELNRLKQSPIDPIRIIADFLAKIKDHMIKHFDNQFGPTLWRSLPITLVVTVPAIWSDAAKDRTLRAVNLAGFSEQGLPNLKRIITTTEPEAAALYTLQSMRGGVQDDHFEVGDGFIVCDMGGGTVDLISYRVSSTSPTTIVEATIGTGDQCGGSFVDRSFIHWLESRLGGEDFKKIAECSADGCSRTSLAPKLGRMVQDFSLTAKSGFSGTEDYYLRLPAPLSGIDDWERGMCDGELHLES